MGYFNYTPTQNIIYLEPLLFLIIAALLAIWFVQTKAIISFTQAEIVFVLFIFYIICKSILLRQFNYTSIDFLLFIIALYFGAKSFFANNTNEVNVKILLYIFTTSLGISIAFALYHYFITKNAFANIYLPNSSIFGILLASQLAFVIPLFFKVKKTVKPTLKLLYVTIIVAATIMLGFTNGRAGWLGFIFAIVYLAYQNLQNASTKKYIVYSITPLLLAIFSLLFFYKQNSSNGRLLIYKVSATMLQNNWLLGIGHGNYKVEYNTAQAAYFSVNNINSKEALLADNTYFAFNDFFQIVVENGIVGLLFLIAFGFLVARQIKNMLVNEKNKHLVYAAIASLICIAIGAMFSYSLQRFPIIFMAILCFAIVNNYAIKTSIAFTFSLQKNKIINFVAVLFSLFLCVHFYFAMQYNFKSNEASDLNRAGFKTKSVAVYNDIYNAQYKDGGTLLAHAQALYYTNNLLKAKNVITKTKQFYNSNEVYKLSADIENELGNVAQAEKEYKIAINMVPNRLITRKKLLDFYVAQKDTLNTIYWAKSITKMKIKIPSSIADNIKETAKGILTKINK
ncbi:MAG: O-antigen ligase family protein [Ferruginibacter sp.]|nr:O-antigen ligase family protein [Ferruginibacter sp.]NOU38860.1 O-antigen ligase family protein [Ferruginibacter sp.]